MYKLGISIYNKQSIKKEGSLDLQNKIKKDISDNKVMLYMKGTKEMPMCRFSSTVVNILNMHNVDYKTTNVLEDNNIRHELSKVSNWPTIPQLYVKGEFLGGCDIIREMYESGELIEYLNTNGIDVQLTNPT